MNQAATLLKPIVLQINMKSNDKITQNTSPNIEFLIIIMSKLRC